MEYANVIVVENNTIVANHLIKGTGEQVVEEAESKFIEMCAKYANWDKLTEDERQNAIEDYECIIRRGDKRRKVGSVSIV